MCVCQYQILILSPIYDVYHLVCMINVQCIACIAYIEKWLITVKVKGAPLILSVG